MRITVSGHVLELEPEVARARLAGHPPEPLHVHWVELDGKRWPPKQALEVISGLQRAAYTAHQALSVLRRLGFETSEWKTARRAPRDGLADGFEPFEGGVEAAAQRERLHESVEALADFMGSQALTARIATLEQQLVGATAPTASAIAEEAEVDMGLLTAAMTVRTTVGRLNDVIHAAVITLTLPHILEAGEAVSNRPSLAAGNDPSRPFDLETDRRVAEFKVSVWRGADAMRKRGVFADLVHLAFDTSGRRRQLFVVGTAPGMFLETSKSPARWGLSRGSAKLKDRFEKEFGSLDVPISEFGAGSGVEIIDLNSVIPGLTNLISKD